METSTERSGGAGPREAGHVRGTAQARDGKAGRVLIVDDNAAVRLLCAANLTAAGPHVFEAADSLDGLEQARCERPDLVLTDVSKPGLDGFQPAERLSRARAPLIFLSGEDGEANAQRAGALGALAYLTKPVDQRALARSACTNSRRREPVIPKLIATVAS